MGRIATNINDQIKLLRERGMDLDLDEEKIKEVLLDIGYYRLGFYWKHFEKDRDHNFIYGTKFSSAVKLYYLDVDLRNILLKFINRIEINFCTKVIYYVSNKYKNSPTWFVDPNVVNTEYIKSFNKFYSKNFIENNKAIKLHHQKYLNDKYAPAWKTLEFFTFGNILTLYTSLKDLEIQERISKEYGILNVKKFIGLFKTIVLIRNICAHGGVLYDLSTPYGMPVVPQINYNNNNRHSLDSALKIVDYILGTISENRQMDFKHALSTLFVNVEKDTAIRSIITKNIGFKC